MCAAFESRGRTPDAEAEDEELCEEAHAGEEERQGEAREGVRQALVHLLQGARALQAHPGHGLPWADGREEGDQGTVSVRGELSRLESTEVREYRNACQEGHEGS